MTLRELSVFGFLLQGSLSYDHEREENLKLDLWTRGVFQFPTDEFELAWNSRFQRSLPVSRVRRDVLRDRSNPFCDLSGYCSSLRGGDSGSGLEAEKVQELMKSLGPDFVQAIERNEKEHEEDCKKSCDLFFCASPGADVPASNEILQGGSITSYSMGPVPPEDFAESFGYPLDMIKVTKDQPLFSPLEASGVLQAAEDEGVEKNEFQSGKYQLAGDWLENLPKTREWFNSRLEKSFFPLLSHLFPEIISSPAVIRAHSVSLLKYNASHPRTDIHIDNGILAMTIAMTPQDQYVGGGTYFEHMGNDNILSMDVGHGTFRPGSVRHGGHPVTQGTRYILGAFLLLEDRVEHVRRLKNRGSALRKENKVDEAAQHFQWALSLNPKCTTCLKDWAEVLHSQRKFQEAEEKIRKALDLLEYQDSDALFVLGVLLSEQGKDDESIEAYQKSAALNSEDAELCYNLGVKLGARGDRKGEMTMYAKATRVDPTFGGAWLNWGTSLAERGELDDAEIMFLKAIQCDPVVSAKGMINLGLLYNTRGNLLAQTGNIEGAKQAALNAARYLDKGKPALDALVSTGTTDNQVQDFLRQYKPLRLMCFRLLGQIYAGEGSLEACEAEFRQATERFADEAVAWQMLHRVLEMRGKKEEAQGLMATITRLGSQ